MLDAKIGGGRLISVLSHDTDTCMASADSTPSDVHGIFPGGNGMTGTIMFTDGSSALLNFLTEANVGIGKEYLEVHCEGQSDRLDNFVGLEDGDGSNLGRWNIPNKEYREELDVFLDVIADPRSEGSLAISRHEIMSNRLMFAMSRRARRGGVIQNIGEFQS